MTTTHITVGASAAAQRFNAACPARSYTIPASTMPPGTSWLDFYPQAAKLRKLDKAVLDGYPDAVEAWSDLSLPEHEREAARQAHVVRQEANEEGTVEAEAWRRDNIDRVNADRREGRAKMIPAALELLDQLEAVLQEDSDAARIVADFRNEHRAKRDRPIRSGQTKLPGAESLPNLRRGIEALRPQPPKRYVSPVEKAKLEKGLDAVDRDGNPLPFEEAEALHKAGRLEISYGNLMPRGSYE